MKKLLAVFLLFISFAAVAYARPAISIRPNSLHFVHITRVVDGDTIIVKFSDRTKTERVRLIGVNTPETVRPNSPIEPYGKEASAYTKSKLSNRDVWLQFDVGLRDKYQRLLAYVWMKKPQNMDDEAEVRRQMFNAGLVLEGYAQTMSIQPNARYADMFVKFQREARKDNKGLWQKR